MDLRESDVQVAVVGLTWTFLYFENAKTSQKASLRNARRDSQEPIVGRRRSKR